MRRLLGGIYLSLNPPCSRLRVPVALLVGARRGYYHPIEKQQEDSSGQHRDETELELFVRLYRLIRFTWTLAELLGNVDILISLHASF